MLLLAAFAVTSLAAEPPRPAGTPARQARATVRIIRADPVRFTEIERESPASLRATVLRSPDGDAREARLLEFE